MITGTPCSPLCIGAPPCYPRDLFAVPVDWAAVESWLGTSLPADYKAIAAAYGPLDIGAWLWLHMPCANRGWFDDGGLGPADSA